MSWLPTVEAEPSEITSLLFFGSQGCKVRLAIGSVVMEGVVHGGLGSLRGNPPSERTQWGSRWYWECGGSSCHGGSQGWGGGMKVCKIVPRVLCLGVSKGGFSGDSSLGMASPKVG